jgi:hypothetical protein
LADCELAVDFWITVYRKTQFRDASREAHHEIIPFWDRVELVCENEIRVETRMLEALCFVPEASRTRVGPGGARDAVGVVRS